MNFDELPLWVEQRRTIRAHDEQLKVADETNRRE